MEFFLPAGGSEDFDVWCDELQANRGDDEAYL